MEAYMNDITDNSFELLRMKASVYVENCMLEIQKDITSLEILEHEESTRHFLESEQQNDTANEVKEEKKKSFIGRIYDGVIKILSKITDTISEFFYNIKATFGKNSLNVDDFMTSNTAQAEFREDMRQVAEFMDKQYAKARPIVSKIAKLTHKDVMEVEKWCDSVTNFAANHGKFVLKVGTMMGIATMIERSLNKQLKLNNEFKAHMNDIKDRVMGKNLDPNKHYSILSRFANSMFALSEMGMVSLDTMYSSIRKFNKVQDKVIKKVIKSEMKKQAKS